MTFRLIKSFRHINEFDALPTRPERYSTSCFFHIDFSNIKKYAEWHNHDFSIPRLNRFFLHDCEKNMTFVLSNERFGAQHFQHSFKDYESCDLN